MTVRTSALTSHATDAAETLDLVEAAAWSDAQRIGFYDVTELVSRLCVVPSGVAPLRPPTAHPAGRFAGREAADWRSIPDLTAAESVTLEMTEQFTMDVGSVTPDLRRRFLEQVGKEAMTVVGIVFVMDFVPRTRTALDVLVPSSPSAVDDHPVTAVGDTGLWDALVSFARIVPRLDTLDPVTTELIRLRGARQHRCRLCQSLRSRPALLAGADDATFAAVDHFDTSDLPPDQRAAIAFTDAMIWTPGTIDPEVTEALVAVTTPAQRVELVLDVTRNALNKVAVAMGADAPHVDEGIEIYDIDGNGDPVFGLTLD
jgi:alkylhydroperoxidase family enzyme